MDDMKYKSEGADMLRFHGGKKFDIQLKDAEYFEKRLGHAMQFANVEKVELKTEQFQWEKYHNICIEFENRGSPSGIATTEADFWVHELARDNQTLNYQWFPINRLKELSRLAMKQGRWKDKAGDDGLSKVVLVPIHWLFWGK